MTLEQAMEKARSNPPNHMVAVSAARVLADEIEQLHEALDMYRNGYQGACMACEPVGEENQRLRDEVARLHEALKMSTNVDTCGDVSTERDKEEA